MKKLLLYGLAAVTAISVGVWYFWPVSAAERAFNRIRLGMTKDEVEAAIGSPAGYQNRTMPEDDYWISCGATAVAVKYIRTTGLSSDRLVGTTGPLLPGEAERVTFKSWAWENHWISVAFDDRSKLVVGYSLLESEVPQPTFFERLRGWIGL
jgi:hypothetical protein